MTLEDLKKKELPDEPGIYFFISPKKEILYIGKATSLRDRVRSYFAPDLMQTRGRLLVDMIALAQDVEVTPTDSVLEALLLEANLIKKHQPKYNTKEKDNRSYNYVVFTDDEFPKILIIRGRTLMKPHQVQENSFLEPYSSERTGTHEIKNFPAPGSAKKYKYIFGPFPHGGQLKEAMKIIRRMFPYTDDKCTPAYIQIKEGRTPRPCFNHQIGLCPGVCTGEISKEEYTEEIKNLKLFFEGKKKTLLKNLEKQMEEYAEKEEFEKAARVRQTIFALNHIQDIALLKSEHKLDESSGGEFTSGNGAAFRIEAYDVAHSAGKHVVGVMVAIEDGEPKKSDYRKFRIRLNPGVNDTGALKEILRRRLGHLEWPLPNLIVVDGAQAQINAAKAILKERGLDINIVSVVKDERHKPREVLGQKGLIESHVQSIILANSEAHRFAITYHRKRRDRLIG